MDTLDCIKTRRSIRKFLPTRIPETVLYSLLDAANQAPAAGNLQTWRFLVIEDEAKKKVIAKSALDQDWLTTAPVVVLILSEPKMLQLEYGKRGVERYDIQNTSVAAENLVLAAWNFGIGSTFISSFTETLLRKEFKIPDSAHIHAIIPLGYPAEFPRPPTKVDIAALTHFEEYGKVVRKEREEVYALVYPEKAEPRLAEAAERRIKKVVKKAKEEIKKRLPKTTKAKKK